MKESSSLEVFCLEKEAIAKELGGQPASSTIDPNFPLEQGKPGYMPILSYPSSLSFYAYNVLCTYI
jgi:hypothetical protein